MDEFRRLFLVQKPALPSRHQSRPKSENSFVYRSQFEFFRDEASHIKWCAATTQMNRECIWVPPVEEVEQSCYVCCYGILKTLRCHQSHISIGFGVGRTHQRVDCTEVRDAMDEVPGGSGTQFRKYIIAYQR